MTKRIPRILWFIPPILLVVATAHLPYGYYTFLRVATCGIAAYIAVHGFQEEPKGKLLAVPLALIAVLWNPIIPIYLHRSTWLYLDIGAAVIFVIHYILVRLSVSSQLRQRSWRRLTRRQTGR